MAATARVSCRSVIGSVDSPSTWMIARRNAAAETSSGGSFASGTSSVGSSGGTAGGDSVACFEDCLAVGGTWVLRCRDGWLIGVRKNRGEHALHEPGEDRDELPDELGAAFLCRPSFADRDA